MQKLIFLGYKIKNLVFLTLVITSLVACRGVEEPTEVDLGILVEHHSQYLGQIVTTWGVLRTFNPPRHYWIETPDLQRVGLVPGHKVELYVDQRVQVTGRFNMIEGAGRQLMVDHIRVYP